MLRGMTTQVNYVDDVEAARQWYTTVLGIEPYFVREAGDGLAYIEFRVGDYQHELGFIDRHFAGERAEPTVAAVDSPLVYWAVDDLAASLQRLLDLGASLHTPAVTRGPGFVTASVVDPFGNPLALMENQHYLDVLTAGPARREPTIGG